MSLVIDSDVWGKFLHSLRSKLSQESFVAWFQPLRFQGLDTGERLMKLCAPAAGIRDWVNNNYSSVVEESLADLKLGGYLIEWTVTDADAPAAGDSQKRPIPSIASAESFRAGVERISSGSQPSQAATVTVTSNQNPGDEPALDTRYTYDSFVVGSCNQFAHAASAAVAEAPGKTYNPLYIYGGVGLGKTHLMHACGNAIRERNKHLRLCYISSEKFMNELINAIRYDRTQNFRERYRSVDVLLIDDVQFMAGKERTQEEFFHTFNSLYEQQKQIVISSDCPPRGIPTLEERLHSRFEWGLIADIEPPDLETKVAILKRKAETMGVQLPDEVALMIAGRVKNNIRELEGSLVRVVAISSLRDLPITMVLAQDALRNVTAEEEPQAITIQKIQKAVAESHRMNVTELIAKGNSKRIVRPRQIAMYLCRRLTKNSYPEIGRAFGGKDHATVMHSFKKIESLVSRDFAIQKQINDITHGLLK